jgi:hypothetical protein
MNFPLLSAIKNIPTQLSIDSTSFKDERDLKLAKHSLILSNFIKLLGIAFIMDEVSRALKIDPKTKLRIPYTKYGYLKMLGAAILAREFLIVGNNHFELFCKRPAWDAVVMHNTKVEKLTNKSPWKWSFSSLYKVGASTCEFFYKTQDLTKEKATQYYVSFLFRNTLSKTLCQRCFSKLTKTAPN